MGVMLTTYVCPGMILQVHSLKLTAKAPKNGWLEYDPFLLGWPIFRGYVSFREGKWGEKNGFFMAIYK